MSERQHDVADRDKRPWQFTLRTLFLVVTVCCAVLGLLTWEYTPLLLCLCVITVGVYAVAVGIRHKRARDVLVGLFMLAMGVALMMPGVGHGSGWGSYVVTAVVVDSATHKPIPGAQVSLVGASGRVTALGIPPAQTGADGTVNLATAFRTHSYSRHYLTGRRQEEGRILLRGDLRVTAKGYEPFEAPLRALIGKDEWDLYGPPFPEMRVTIQRKPAGVTSTEPESGSSTAQTVKEGVRTWCSVAIPFLVQDASTGSPVPRATIRIIPPKDSPAHVGVRKGETTGEGLVTMTGAFPFKNNAHAVATLECVDPTGYMVEIDAVGHSLLRKPLASYVGPGWKLFHPLHELVVELQAKPSERDGAGAMHKKKQGP